MLARRESFPPGFLWGVSTAAYQIEGAAREDGRGESIWDRFAHTPGKTANGDSGDVACDHYHRYPEDVKLMQSLGLNAYRFSVAWPRIQPAGMGAVNPAGLAFYDRLVDALLAAGITPIVTLYHWDLPQALQDRGGWAERATAYAFADYAEIVVRRLGDRVKHWTTHNEPWCTAFLSNQIGLFAPGLQDWRIALAVSHHLLLSHGLAVPRIRAAGGPGTLVSIAPNLTTVYPASAAPEDVAAARRFDGYFNRWFLDPLAGRGYPEDMWALYGADVPQVQPGDLELIAAPLDFVGVNYYNHATIADAPADPPLRTRSVESPELERTADREIHPESFYEMLVRLSREYPFPAYIITENGAAYHDTISPDGRVHDEGRVRFLDSHLAAVGRAIEAGAPIQGYCLWSLLDNFEWAAGYTLRYGITYVDYATQARIIKDSGIWYRDFIRAGG